MRVHHLNCGTMCPLLRPFVNGDGSLSDRAKLICHCLLIESDRGLVLVDTGYGVDDVANPRKRLGPIAPLLQARLDPNETAARQVAALGFSRDDVRHVILTHLDLDHAGGISDFPKARVHVMRREHDLAMERRLLDRLRYRPAHWEHGPIWALHEVGSGEPWFGFEAVRALDGLPPEFLMVPLAGHTLGHAGVAIDTSEGWLLHAGDAYFYRDEMHPERPRCTPGLDLFQRAAQRDGTLRLWNQRRLRALVREQGHQVRVFCAHDEAELTALQSARSADRSGSVIAPEPLR